MRTNSAPLEESAPHLSGNALTRSQSIGDNPPVPLSQHELNPSSKIGGAQSVIRSSDLDDNVDAERIHNRVAGSVINDDAFPSADIANRPRQLGPLDGQITAAEIESMYRPPAQQQDRATEALLEAPWSADGHDPNFLAEARTKLVTESRDLAIYDEHHPRIVPALQPGEVHGRIYTPPSPDAVIRPRIFSFKPMSIAENALNVLGYGGAGLALIGETATGLGFAAGKIYKKINGDKRKKEFRKWEEEIRKWEGEQGEKAKAQAEEQAKADEE